MRELPLNHQKKGTVLVEDKTGHFWSRNVQNSKKGVIFEPRSVLDQRSPSPPTSTSTLSPSLGGGAAWFTGVAAVSDKWRNAAAEEGGRKEEWLPELHPVPASLEMDWDGILSESAAASPGQQEHTFLRWIMGDVDEQAKQQNLMLSSPTSMVEIGESGSHGLDFGVIDHGFGFEPNNASASGINSQLLPIQIDSSVGDKNPIFTASIPLSLPPGMFFQEANDDEKPQFFGSNLVLNQVQQTQVAANPAFFVSLPSFASSMDNVVPSPHPGAGSELFLRPQANQCLDFPQLHSISYHLQHRPLKPKSFSAGDEAMAIQHQHQHALVDQLLKAAELVEAGNLVGANGILARLNHQLPSSIGKPFLRSAFYFKEALQILVNSANPQLATSSPSRSHRTPFTSPLSTPLDVVLKLSAYKAFSEVSPILQFTNFTATQALLEELGASDCIHIIDFDIGVGGQWSSFMQELAHRRSSSSSSSISLLKITAFVSPYAFHPLELHLTKENLSHFASDLNIPFEFNIASIESFDPAEILVLSAGSNEAIAVNLPVGSWQGTSFPTLLRFVKQLLPKIVISVDQGCDRGDLLFSHYFLHALQSCIVLLDSFDAAGTDHDVINKIERFVLQPRIENCVIGRHCNNEKMLPWRTLFASAGFVPFQFSNFTETQAECLLKRVQVRGFHVEKRQSALYLYWQRGELASVSAWKC